MMHLETPNISHYDKNALAQAISRGDIISRAPMVPAFESAMAEYLGVTDAVAVNSGTSALHLALLACGVGPRDEVIVPALTYIATANAVRYTGAKTVFVDVDLKTWNMNYTRIAQVTTDRLKAIVPVHLYGNPCIYGISVRGDISFIEDAAEAMGAEMPEVNPDFRCFSFNNNKIITTGSGGLITGDNLAGVRELFISRDATKIVYNYYMPALAASLGLAQLQHLPSFLSRKRRFNEIYREELTGLVKFQEPTPGSNPSWWYTACLFEGRDVVAIKTELIMRGIPTRRVFFPIPLMLGPYFDGERTYPNAKYIFDYGLCLPSSTLNGEENILRVCKTIKEILAL